jgi:hypothetical protein
MTCNGFDRNLLSPSLKMEKTGSSTALVPVYETAWCHVPKDYNFHLSCCENFKSNM